MSLKKRRFLSTALKVIAVSTFLNALLIPLYFIKALLPLSSYSAIMLELISLVGGTVNPVWFCLTPIGFLIPILLFATARAINRQKIILPKLLLIYFVCELAFLAPQLCLMEHATLFLINGILLILTYNYVSSYEMMKALAES